MAQRRRGLWTWRHAAALRAVKSCRGPECSDGHGVVEGHVALLLEVREVGLGLGRQLDALDERERAQPGPQVDVVVREAALSGLGCGLGSGLGRGVGVGVGVAVGVGLGVGLRVGFRSGSG